MIDTTRIEISLGIEISLQSTIQVQPPSEVSKQFADSGAAVQNQEIERAEMGIVILLLFAVLFTAFAALVFSLLTLLLGLVWEDFEVSGPEGWTMQTFGEFYLRYLIIAAVFTFVSLPLGNGILGIGAMAIAYKYVFDAGWLQACVIGVGGGIIAAILFVLLLGLVLG